MWDLPDERLLSAEREVDSWVRPWKPRWDVLVV